jgi:hypothetical protein
VAASATGSPPQYPLAPAAGHDPVRDGTGWSDGALDHAYPRPADQDDTRQLRLGVGSALDHEHGLAPVRYRLSTGRLATGSSPRGLTGYP